MTAPMTRERLALLRDGYKPALDSYDSEDFVEVCVADLRELVSACEALLNERESVRDAALEEAVLEWWSGFRPATFTEADHCAMPTVNTTNDREKNLARLAAQRALKGKR